jgi:hypothetical protein
MSICKLHLITYDDIKFIEYILLEYFTLKNVLLTEEGLKLKV